MARYLVLLLCLLPAILAETSGDQENQPNLLTGQGMTGQGYTGQGMTGQGMTGQGYAGQGMTGQGFNNFGQGMNNMGGQYGMGYMYGPTMPNYNMYRYCQMVLSSFPGGNGMTGPFGPYGNSMGDQPDTTVAP